MSHQVVHQELLGPERSSETCPWRITSVCCCDCVWKGTFSIRGVESKPELVYTNVGTLAEIRMLYKRSSTATRCRAAFVESLLSLLTGYETYEIMIAQKARPNYLRMMDYYLRVNRRLI
jgi:hypothetical protein